MKEILKVERRDSHLLIVSCSFCQLLLCSLHPLTSVRNDQLLRQRCIECKQDADQGQLIDEVREVEEWDDDDDGEEDAKEQERKGTKMMQTKQKRRRRRRGRQGDGGGGGR